MITNLLLTVISLGTWRGAGHSKHTAQSVAQQNQMLFDAMTDEEQVRVLGAAAERKRIVDEAHAQMLREGADRAFMWRVGILVFFLIAAAVGMIADRHPSTKPQAVSTIAAQPVPKPQPVAKPKEKTCWIYDRSMEMCLSGWE